MESSISLLVRDGHGRTLGTLELGDDFAVSLEWVSPLAEERRAWSYDFDVPATPRNLHTLGDPDLRPQDWEALEWGCVFAGTPLALEGRLRCTGYDGARLTLNFQQRPGFWEEAARTAVDGLVLPRPTAAYPDESDTELVDQFFARVANGPRGPVHAVRLETRDPQTGRAGVIVRVEAFYLLGKLIERVGYGVEADTPLPLSEVYVMQNRQWYGVNTEGERLTALDVSAVIECTDRKVSTLLRDLCTVLGVRLWPQEEKRTVSVLHFTARQGLARDRWLGPMGYCQRPEVVVPGWTRLSGPALGEDYATGPPRWERGGQMGYTACRVELPPLSESVWPREFKCRLAIVPPGGDPEGEMRLFPGLLWGARTFELGVEAWQNVPIPTDSPQFEPTLAARQSTLLRGLWRALWAEGGTMRTVRKPKAPLAGEEVCKLETHAYTPGRLVAGGDTYQLASQGGGQAEHRWQYVGALARTARFARMEDGRGGSYALRLREAEHGFARGRTEFVGLWDGGHILESRASYEHFFDRCGVPERTAEALRGQALSPGYRVFRHRVFVDGVLLEVPRAMKEKAPTPSPGPGNGGANPVPNPPPGPGDGGADPIPNPPPGGGGHGLEPLPVPDGTPDGGLAPLAEAPATPPADGAPGTMATGIGIDPDQFEEVDSPAELYKSQLHIHECVGVPMLWNNTYYGALGPGDPPATLYLRRYPPGPGAHRVWTGALGGTGYSGHRASVQHRSRWLTPVHRRDSDARAGAWYDPLKGLDGNPTPPQREGEGCAAPWVYCGVGEAFESDHDAWLRAWVACWGSALEGDLLRWDEAAVLEALREHPRRRLGTGSQLPLRVGLTLRRGGVSVDRVRVALWDDPTGRQLLTARQTPPQGHHS